MLSNQPRTIIIIGGGFSGSMVAVHLLRLAKHPLTIKLIERQTNIGQGIAYRTPLDCHLLNVPAGKMGAFSGDVGHFLRWLQQDNPEITATTFVPRKYYGQYIRSLLKDTQTNAPPEVKLEYITDEAINIKTDRDGSFVFCSSGEVIQGDKIVLALGNLPPANLPIANSSFYQSQRYISWAWSNFQTDNISAHDPVLLIGSGLTAVDILLALHQQGHKGQIYLVSRRGLLPHSHQPTQPYQVFLDSNQPQTIRILFKQIRQEIKKAIEQGYDWRDVIDSLRPQTQILWQNLSLVEKTRFLRHVRPFWDIHRHRLAPNVAKILNQLLNEKQAILYAGQVQAYQEDSEGVNVCVRLRNSQQLQFLRVGSVINCTGSERFCSQWQHPLLSNLLTSELAKLDSLSLGLEVNKNGALINANGLVSSCLYTLGSIQKGSLWETTAIAEIRQQAENLAKDLLINI